MTGPVLGLVPARGGSKGIPGKNLKPLAGRPLLAYTADAARASGALDRLVLTTDAAEIAEAGRALGLEVPFVRPAALAADDTPMVRVVEHAVRTLDGAGWRAEVIVLLQPTAPLRRPEHIVRALEILATTGCDAVASVVEVPRHFSPDYVMRLDAGRLVSFLPEGGALTRRQDARPAYSRDGTVYVMRRRTLLEEGSLYGRDCRALILGAGESVNLDTLEDWRAAEERLARRAAGAASRDPAPA
jgi:CMP-N-acetylneuraminic acid synthetase